MKDSQAIESWVQTNIDQLLLAHTDDDILDVVWPAMFNHVHNTVFKKSDKPVVLQEIAREWIQGKPFHELFGTLKKRKVKLIWVRDVAS